MSKLAWVLLLILGLAIIGVLVWPNLWADSDTIEQEPVELIVPPSQTPQAKKTVVKTSPKQAAAEEDDNPFADDAFKAQLLQVADLYEETSRYPVNSQPIRNLDAAREAKPFEAAEVDTPFPSEDGESTIRLQASVDKYQYFSGDIIRVRLGVLGAPADVFVKASATVSGSNGDTPLSADLDPSDDSLSLFTGQFDLQVSPPQLLTSEMLLKLLVIVGDEQLFTTVGFRYAVASATLVGVPYQRQEGAYLNIPLQYNVKSSGYYFSRGILEDAASGRPLIQLQAEGMMAQGNGVLMMKAHIQALKVAGSEGPYVLRSLVSYRGAEQGELFDAPASNARERFEIQGYPFSQYDDEAYENPDAQDSIDFIKGLGGSDTNTTQ